MQLNHFFACFASEDTMTCEHAIEYSPKGINVCICINSLPENLLWCRRAGLTHAIYTFSDVGCVESSTCMKHVYDSEIRNKQVAILIDEDTVRRKITM